MWMQHKMAHVLISIAIISAVGISATPTWAGGQPGHTPPSVAVTALRTVHVGATAEAMAVDMRTNRVFVVNGGALAYPDKPPVNSVVTLDARSGALLHTTLLPGQPFYLDVDARLGRVFVTNPVRSAVDILDATTGALIRATAVPSGPSVIAVDERTGRVFVLTDNTMTVLDAASGRVLRGIPGFSGSSTSYNTLAIDAPAGRLFIRHSPPAASCRATGGACIDVLDAATGAPLPPLPVAEPADSVFVDAQAGRVMAMGEGGVVSVLDSSSGTRVADTTVATVPRAKVTSLPIHSAAVDSSDSRAVVLSAAVPDGPGLVAVLDTRAGRLVRRLVVDRPQPHAYLNIATGADDRGGYLYAATEQTDPNHCCQPLGHTRLTVLDATGGQVLGVVPVGHGAPTIAVDGQTGRAFVATQEDGMVTVVSVTRR